MNRFALLLLASTLFAQNRQPNVSNTHLETRAFSGDLASEMKIKGPAWFGYEIKTMPGDHRSCCSVDGYECGCSLEDRSGSTVVRGSANSPIPLEGSTAMAVLFRVESNAVQKMRAFSLDCPLDAGGLPFRWITGVPVAASVAYLEKLVGSDESRRVTDGAVFALSQHDSPEALDALIRMAHTNASVHVREQALFWLAQRAGARAVAAIQDAVVNDPNTDVKKRAVFALSQLPPAESVPDLIAVARTQRNPEVRKQAFFWLGQSRDPRALAFIEQVLTK